MKLQQYTFLFLEESVLESERSDNNFIYAISLKAKAIMGMFGTAHNKVDITQICVKTIY